MPNFADKRWKDLPGEFRTPFGPRPALSKLEPNVHVKQVWPELWEELHHQGDVGEVSYATVPHLLRIYRQRRMEDWNTFRLFAVIALARGRGKNPDVPKWLKKDHFHAIRERMRRLFFALAILLPHSMLSQSNPMAPVLVQLFEIGRIVAHIPCAAHPEQSYALYLPSNYSSDRRWPIVYSFDPAARGTVPLELQKEAAEHNGYILAASNNSRNGPWKGEVEAADAMVTDTQTRFSIDQQRIYFAGFSGGARVAAQLAIQCKCTSGVLLSGAGFPAGNPPTKDAVFPVFTAVGTIDFNYAEVIPLHESLEKAGYPHWLRVFEGPHDWAPAEVMEEALQWFRVQAMQGKREQLDQSFVDAQFTKAMARGSSLEKTGDLLTAWRQYLQIAATYDSLLDVSLARVKAAALGQGKVVRDALKRERSDFEEQARLAGGVSGRVAAKQADDAPLSESEYSLQGQIQLLRHEAEQEKRPERERVYQRVVGEIFVRAMELGDAELENKEYEQAIRAFTCAVQTKPDSQWALRDLAAAQALSGKRKEAISTLRRARDLSKEKSVFDEWLKAEPAFERLRTLPEFQNLIDGS